VLRLNARLSSAEIVALQVLLGSDPEREKFNLARVMSDRRAIRKGLKWKSQRWNILFSRKVS
jgi:hypothetical protein